MIFFDPRFGSEKDGQRSTHRVVAETLPSLGVETEPSQLPFGDFTFIGNGPERPIQIGVELKAVPDLVTSIRSGRLAEQLIGMVQTFARSYLIVEGLYRAGRRSGLLEVPRAGGYRPITAGPRPVFWTEIEKFLVGAEEAGIRVHHTRTSYQTAQLLAQVLWSYWNKDYDDHASFNVLYRPAPLQLVREDEDTRRLRLVAACLPGIGWKRSKAVAERFKSIRRLVAADADEWGEIEGIGKTIAGQVVKALGAESPKSRVRQGDRVSAGSTRHPRKREDTKLDAGGRAQRRVPETRTGRRLARRSQSRRLEQR